MIDNGLYFFFRSDWKGTAEKLAVFFFEKDFFRRGQ
jgi:hypothetical protein